jgi:hypothetical protein
MSIGGDYTKPVYVNGYQCWNCAQVDEAKKGVDPAHAKDASGAPSSNQGAGQTSAVTFGGALAGAQPGASASNQRPNAAPGAGAALDVTV